MGLKGRSNAKIKLKPAQNVRGSNPKEIISESIESLKEPSSNGVVVPSRGGKGGRGGMETSAGVKRGHKKSPRVFPALEGDTSGPKHCRQVNSQDRSKGKEAILF